MPSVPVAPGQAPYLVNTLLHLIDKLLATKIHLVAQLAPRRGLMLALGDETLIALYCPATLIAECHENPICAKSIQVRLVAERCPITAPRPLDGGADHFRPHGIEHDITGQLQQVRAFLNENRLVPPLEKVTYPVMLAVEADEGGSVL